MAIDELLSQEEIDALLEAVADGDVPGATPLLSAEAASAQPFDFGSPARVVHGYLPTLEMINERFVHGFRLSLFNLVQQSAELTPGGIQVVGLSEYMSTLSIPTSINLVRIKPLRGTALVVFEPHLVSTVVNAFFGGNSRLTTRAERGASFTSSEQRIVRRLLDGVFEDLRAAWRSVMDLEFEHLGAESNPKYATVRGAGDSEPMVVNVIKVALDGGDGAFHVLMPYSMFEPLRERLGARIQHAPGETDTRFRAALLEGLGDAGVELASTLLYAQVTINDLLRLKKGDVIPVQVPSSVTLDVDGTPVHRGVYGSVRNVCAVQVTGPVVRS